MVKNIEYTTSLVVEMLLMDIYLSELYYTVLIEDIKYL